MTLLALPLAGMLLLTSHARAQETAVTGTVTYLERMALPPGAVVTVQLADVSLADAPAELLSQQVITTTGEQPPFPFTLPYDPAQIDERFDYAVQARIELDGQLLFINTERYAVITKGNPTEIEVVVQRVAETPAETSAVTPTVTLTETALMTETTTMTPTEETTKGAVEGTAPPAQMPTTGGAPSLALTLLAVAGTLLVGGSFIWLKGKG
jgi:uncharacterized lipoprotein YbaY